MRVRDDLARGLRPPTAEAACKACGAASPLHGVVDFNKSCEAAKKIFFPLAGVPVFYRRCEACGFLFTDAFDDWAPADFQRHVYNEDYIRVDPDYAGARARGSVGVVVDLARQLGATRVLDYGGGEGTLAGLLRQQGLDAQSWDPIASDQPVPAPGMFQLVTCFEVLEHTPTPLATCRQALSFLRPDGRMLFSTLTIDGLEPQACDFWYLAPRNGHVSLYTRRSLEILFGQLGWSLRSFGNLYHLAHR